MLEKEIYSNMPKIVNGFPFFNEIRLLLFKLTELWEVVDYFVIVESCQTHSGESKEFFLENELDSPEFAPFRSKIIYEKLDYLIPGTDPWLRETHQRNMIMRGIERLRLNDDDVLLIGDLDEIPDAFYTSMIRRGELAYNQIVRCRQDMYYYNFNCKSLSQFTGLFYATYDQVKTLMYQGVTLNTIRRLDLPLTEFVHGWHLSFFGDVEAIQKKLKSFVHAPEYDQEKFTESFITDCIQHQKNIFHKEGDQYGEFIYISLKDNPNLPKHVEMLITNES